MQSNQLTSSNTALMETKTRLSSGCFGETMLVQSLEDYQLYVRKVEHVRRYNPNRLFQSDDVEHAVYHPYIPNLETWRDHISENGKNGQITADNFVLSTSTWFFCNGGTMMDFCTAIENAYDDTGTLRVPEACLWKFLHCIFDVLTHIHRSGIAHSDAHENNWFLHWPAAHSALPEIRLGDFGLATRYPAISHQDFQLPFLGNFDWRNQAAPPNISQDDLNKLTEWYTLVREDWKDGLDLIRTLLFFSDETIQFFGQEQASRRQQINLAAETGKGLMGYSAELVAVLSTIQKTTETCWKHPAALGHFFAKVVDPLNQLVRDAVGKYLAGPDRNSMLPLRPPLPIRKPVVYKDPRLLLDFANFGYTDSPPINVKLRRQYEAETGHSFDMDHTSFLFAQYRDGDNLISDPVIELGHPDLGDYIRVRRREYRVACIQQETADPSRFRFLKFVDALDDCAPLSPDAKKMPLKLEKGDESETQEVYIKIEESDSDDHPSKSLYTIPQHAGL